MKTTVLERLTLATDLDARIAAGLVRLEHPDEKLRSRSSRTHPELLDYPAACAVPTCLRQHGWWHVDPRQDWETYRFTLADPPTFPTRSSYSYVFDGHLCTPCGEAQVRARWLRHVLADIKFQHSEEAKAEQRFAAGPPESDPRWAPFTAELEALRGTADAVEALERRPDVVKDTSYRAYKAHFFAFMKLRQAILNPGARSDMAGGLAPVPTTGRLIDKPVDLALAVQQAVWEYAQLGLEGPGCDRHAKPSTFRLLRDGFLDLSTYGRQEDCEACKALPCGVDVKHVDPRWKMLADEVAGPDAWRVLVKLAKHVAAGRDVTTLLAWANREVERERDAEARAFEQIWKWNREHDAECLVRYKETKKCPTTS